MSEKPPIAISLEQIAFASSCNVSLTILAGVVTGLIESGFQVAAVTQALGEALRRTGIGILKERQDAKADNVAVILGKMQKMMTTISVDWHALVEQATVPTELMAEPFVAPMAPTIPDPEPLAEQPRRAVRQSVIGGKFQGAPTIRVPGIDVPLPLLTKGFLVDQTDGESGDTLHLSGCGGPELSAFYDVDKGLLIMQCADCGRYIGAVRVANES